MIRSWGLAGGRVAHDRGSADGRFVCAVDALLPVLQAYMGHSSISDTAYYLRRTAESYPQIAARVRQAAGNIVPPVAGGPRHGD
jgi:hypothetical protein